MQHLDGKFKPDCDNIPPLISKYSQAAIFSGGDNNEEAPAAEHSQQTPLVYGNLQLDEDEVQAILMDPKFAALNSLVDEDFDLQVESCITKMKWNRMSDLNNCETEEEREEMEMEDAMSREVYDAASKVFDSQKQRVTDLQQNAWVHLPRPQPVDYEALLEIRRQKYLETFQNYKTENCDEKGRQKSNLTVQQASGIRKLKKRMEEGEIIIAKTDKSGRLCVMPTETYIEAGSAHTAKDRVVDEEFIKKTQRTLNGHVSMWIKMLNQGANWEHQERLRETQINHSCAVSPLYLLFKDHSKSYAASAASASGSASAPGPPPSRPVCGAVSGMNHES